MTRVVIDLPWKHSPTHLGHDTDTGDVYMSGAQSLFHGCLVKKGPTDQGIQFFSQVDTSGTPIVSAAAGGYHTIAVTST